MFRRFSINFALMSIVLDALIVILALYFANAIRPELNQYPIFRDVDPDIIIPLILYIIFPAIWVAILLLLAVYDGRKNLRVTNELTSLTLGALLAGVALAGLLYLSYRDISRALFLIFATSAYLLQVLWRLAARGLYRLKSGSYTRDRRVLIAGAGPVGRNLQNIIQENAFLGLEMVGFLDDDPDKRLTRIDVLGVLGAAGAIIQENHIDDVVIALPPRAYEQVNHLVAELHHLPVKLWIVPDYFHLALHKAVVEEFAEIPMLDLRAPALNDYQRMVKRAFDLLLVILCLPLL